MRKNINLSNYDKKRLTYKNIDGILRLRKNLSKCLGKNTHLLRILYDIALCKVWGECDSPNLELFGTKEGSRRI